MDKATREQRRRNKAMTNGRGNLPDFAPRGLGRKGKPSETFPLRQCSHIEGGHTRYIPIRKKQASFKPGERKVAMIPIISGGKRCTTTSVVGTFCLEHIEDLKKETDDE